MVNGQGIIIIGSSSRKRVGGADNAKRRVSITGLGFI